MIVNINLYSTLSHSAYTVLNALNTAKTDASLAGDQSRQCWGLYKDRCQNECRDDAETTLLGSVFQIVVAATGKS